VDVLVNDQVAFQNVKFTELTRYATLEPGSYNIKVVPAGVSEPVVINADVELTVTNDRLSESEEGVYTIAAVGRLAEIEPLVLVHNESRPGEGQAKVRFIHASPNAPAVDIAVKGGPVLFSNISFKNASDYVDVPAGNYNLEVRLAGTETVALEVPGVNIKELRAYAVYAMGLAGEEPPLQAVLSVEEEDFQEPGQGNLRIVHASPDAPAVDVLVDGEPVFKDVSFEEITEFRGLSIGSHNIQVVPAGASEPVVIDATLEVKDEGRYTIVATGRLAEIAPVVLSDDFSWPANGEARVRFTHASPNAPAVDIAVKGGPVLFSNVPFRESSTITVPAGTYDLEVRPAGAETVVLELPGIQLTSRAIYSVFATGLVGEEPPLNAILSLDKQSGGGDH
jgi:hypothetical protein